MQDELMIMDMPHQPNIPPAVPMDTGPVVTASEMRETPEELAAKLMRLQKKYAHLNVMAIYEKLELQNLKREMYYAQEEVSWHLESSLGLIPPFQVKRVQSVPLVIGQFIEAVDADHAIVQSTTGNNSSSK